MTSLTWASSTTPPPNTTKWTSICCGNNKFVAVGRDVGAAVYSTDGGNTWINNTSSPTDIEDGIWQSVCFDGFSLFVAVSGNITSGTPVMYSTDGQNWDSTGISGVQYADWRSVCFGNGIFVAVSPTYTMWSSDALNWNVITNPPSGPWVSVCYGYPSELIGPLFVAVGTDAIMNSSDGQSWFYATNQPTGQWQSVYYGGETGSEIYMAVGISTNMTSSDGDSWTIQNTVPTGTNWYSVCYASNGTDNVFVVTDDSNSVTTNDLGLNWTQSSTPSGTVSWESVAYNPSLNYLAAVSYNNIQNQGMYALLCFKEGSKILTDKGYVTIENLRKGDNVQTLKDGFKKIVFLGKKKMEQNGVEERIKDQLYKYSSKEYPELFEDLVLTGGHSILVDNLTDEERENMRITMFDLFKGEDFVIDNKKCLLSYLNNKAEVYEKKGKHTIYHFALEGDYYKNYGVYANGLLVEACSQHVFLEYVHPDTTFCERTLFYLIFILTHLSDITEFIKSKSMGLLKMRRKLKNEKLVNENDSFSEFHSVF